MVAKAPPPPPTDRTANDRTAATAYLSAAEL